MIDSMYAFLVIIMFISGIYLLSRYPRAKDFNESNKKAILLRIRSESDEAKRMRLVDMYCSISFKKTWLSTKPLKLRYYFTREDILLFNRKVKKKDEKTKQTVQEEAGTFS